MVGIAHLIKFFNPYIGIAYFGSYCLLLEAKIIEDLITK